jgi:hypothetical protein
MSTTTQKFGLFKYEPIADAKKTFNITESMNDNFDKIDKAISDINIAVPCGACTTAGTSATKDITITNFTEVDNILFACTMQNVNASNIINFTINGGSTVYALTSLKGNTIAGTEFTNAANEEILFKLDKTNSKIILVKADFWDVRKVMPDYANGVNKPWGTNCKADRNGFIKVTANNVSGNAASMYIDSILIWYQSTWNGDACASGMIPISRGSQYIAQGGSSGQILVFYPMKGEE